MRIFLISLSGDVVECQQQKMYNKDFCTKSQRLRCFLLARVLRVNVYEIIMMMMSIFNLFNLFRLARTILRCGLLRKLKDKAKTPTFSCTLNHSRGEM